MREVRPHEAYDFTADLQENLDLINEVTNLNLIGAEREQAAGAFGSTWWRRTRTEARS